VHHGVDEVHIQRVHVVDPPGGLLEGCETVIHGCVCDKRGSFVPVCVVFPALP
jgi:hypothetical protein